MKIARQTKSGKKHSAAAVAGNFNLNQDIGAGNDKIGAGISSNIVGQAGAADHNLLR